MLTGDDRGKDLLERVIAAAQPVGESPAPEATDHTTPSSPVLIDVHVRNTESM
jgi:hypothetical protein